MGKITKIQIKVPTESTVPDGRYLGTYGGYCIESNICGKTYQFTTEEGVRGFGYKVVIFVKDGVATYEEINN